MNKQEVPPRSCVYVNVLFRTLSFLWNVCWKRNHPWVVCLQLRVFFLHKELVVFSLNPAYQKGAFKTQRADILLLFKEQSMFAWKVNSVLTSYVLLQLHQLFIFMHVQKKARASQAVSCIAGVGSRHDVSVLCARWRGYTIWDFLPPQRLPCGRMKHCFVTTVEIKRGKKKREALALCSLPLSHSHRIWNGRGSHVFGNNDEGTAAVQKTVYNYSALAVNFDPSGFGNHSGKPVRADMAALGQQ